MMEAEHHANCTCTNNQMKSTETETKLTAPWPFHSNSLQVGNDQSYTMHPAACLESPLKQSHFAASFLSWNGVLVGGCASSVETMADSAWTARRNCGFGMSSGDHKQIRSAKLFNFYYQVCHRIIVLPVFNGKER